MTLKFNPARVVTIDVTSRIPKDGGGYVNTSYKVTFEAGKADLFEEGDDIEPKEARRVMADQLAQHIRNWDIQTLEGDPLECSLDNIRELLRDPILFKDILKGWMRASAGAAAKN